MAKMVVRKFYSVMTSFYCYGDSNCLMKSIDTTPSLAFLHYVVCGNTDLDNWNLADNR